jgi:hypothetical protein
MLTSVIAIQAKTRKFITYTFILFCFVSCTGVRIPKDEFKTIDASFKGCFYNRVSQANGRHADSTLLNVFQSWGYKTDSVTLQFNAKNQLELNFGDPTHPLTFDGKFKKGYYEIYLRKMKKDIPPIVPIIYSNHDIYRLRIALANNKDLIVDNKWERDASFLMLMAAGGSGRRHYRFSPVRK